MKFILYITFVFFQFGLQAQNDQPTASSEFKSNAEKVTLMIPMMGNINMEKQTVEAAQLEPLLAKKKASAKSNAQVLVEDKISHLVK